MSAHERVLDALRDHGSKVRANGGRRASAQCPAHEDRAPSLSVRGIEGQALVYDHGGCDTVEVLSALDLTLADLYDDPRGAAYRYDNGRTVVRTPDKRFRQIGTEHPPELYRLAKVKAAVAAGQTIFVVEGEKDVHAIESLGGVATCSPMGAGKWSKVDPSPLYGATVVVVADQDEPGRAHAADVRASLRGHAAVSVVAAREGKDAADHITAGCGLDDFEPLEDETAPSWAPVDLSAYLNGTHTPAVPTLMQRTDGVCLIYLALTHSFHGESESGKSMLLQIEAAALLMAGEHVLFIDFESDPESITDRLLMFGATPEAINERFVYINPEVDPRTSDRELRAWAALLGRRFTLAIIDGVTDSLGVFGYSTKDNDDITAWMRVVPKSIARHTGAAVVVIDHVTKDGDSRGRFAIGGQAKLSGLTGAAYTVEVVEPLGRGLRGVIVVRVGKDRPGHVRGHSGPMRKTDRTQETARIIVDSTGPVPVVTVEPWHGHDLPAGQSHRFRPTSLMEKIAAALAIASEPVSFRGIDERVTGKREHIRTALDVLISEGYVTLADGPRNSQIHTLAKSYDPHADPLSDLYRDPGHTQPPKSTVTVPVPYTGERGTHTQPFPGTVGAQSGNSREDGPNGGEDPPGATCADCGEPLHWQRVAYGKTLCVDCEPRSTS
jgi:hypothetical protein